MAINTSHRLAGVIAMTIDGNAFDVVSDAVWRPSIPKRETMKGQSRVEGYSEMPQEGMMGATIRDNGGVAVQALGNLTNSTVLFTLASGKSVLGSGMWVTALDEVKTSDATYSIRFEGPDVSEITV
jgi:hypothetical protein